MFTTIGAILEGGSRHAPAPAPVRRGSSLRGRCEGSFWRPTTRQAVRRVLLAARRYDLVERARGRRNGPLGHIALEVLELLANLVSYRTGRLEPSHEYLMRTLRRSRDAVVRALRALREHGFLDRLRRYEPTGQEGRGPQVRQVSNAYRLSLPARAMRMLGRLVQAPPMPEDLSHAQETRRAEMDLHRASLPLDELARFEVNDGPLATVLASLGRAVQQRESASRSESKTKKNTRREPPPRTA